MGRDGQLQGRLHPVGLRDRLSTTPTSPAAVIMELGPFPASEKGPYSMITAGSAAVAAYEKVGAPQAVPSACANPPLLLILSNTLFTAVCSVRAVEATTVTGSASSRASA